MKVVLLVAALLATSFAQSEKQTRRHSLQRSAYNLIFAAVEVNGKAALALIDSGSFRAVQLSSTLAAEIGLALTETNKVARRYEGKELRLQRGRLNKFVIGDDQQRDLEVEVIEGDIERIAPQVKTKFDVILGWGFLARYHMLLDYQNLEMKWSKTPFAAGQEKLSFDYTVVNNVPVVKGAIDGQAVNFLFDTGAPICNLDPSLTDAPVGAQTRKDTLIGKNKLSVEFRAKDLAVIRQSLGCAAVIGNNLLAGYKVYFDTTNKVIRLY